MTAIVALVGVPGAGKTTIGRRLAADIGVDFLDTDQLIEAREGRSVGDIFIQDGEDAFRVIECEVVARAIVESDGVLALGGGAVLDAGTRALLADIPTVWLSVDPETAVRRVGLNAARPMLLRNVGAQLKGLMEQREPLYTEVSDLVVDNSDREAQAVARDVVVGLGLTVASENLQ